MSKELIATKAPVATQMAMFTVVKKVVKAVIPSEEISEEQIDTIIMNKILDRCSKVGGAK